MNFIGSLFIEWFDAQNHDVVFYECLNVPKKLPQRLKGLSRSFVDIRKKADELAPITGWKTPRYGMGSKYSKRDIIKLEL